MRRALLALTAALFAVAVITASASSQLTGTRIVTTRSVDCTTTIAAHLAVSNPNRLNLTLQNVGTIHAGIAGQDVSNTHLAARGFLTLHAGAAIEFANFQGGLTCLAGGGGTTIQILEEIR